MVIWYLCKYASPEKYFFGTRHFYLGREWVKKEHEVTIFTSNSNHLTKNLPQFKNKSYCEEIDGIKTIWLKGLHPKKSSGLTRIISWLHFEWQIFTVSKKKLKKPDIVIASSLSLLTVISGYWFSKKYKAKFIFEVRDIWPLSAIELGNYSKSNPLIKFLLAVEKFGYSKSNAIVGTIPNLGMHVEKIIGSRNKCYCIPQGVSLEFYKKNAQLSEDYINEFIPYHKFIIAYAGTLNANNPLEILIQAAKLLKDDKNIHFLILGKGDRKEKLMQMSLNLSNVSFPPVIDKSEVYNFLQHVHVGFDSFSSELAKFGLSRNKWIDYMYAMKPIICSYSGFQSMINEANCGSFVEYGNAAALANEILTYSRMDRNELARLGENGKNFLIENRTFDKLASEYLNIMSLE